MVHYHDYGYFKQPLRVSKSQDFSFRFHRDLKNIGISDTQKIYSFEDHELESMQNINSMGNKNKYFIDLYHQDVSC